MKSTSTISSNDLRPSPEDTTTASNKSKQLGIHFPGRSPCRCEEESPSNKPAKTSNWQTSSHNHPPRSHAESPVHTKVEKAKERGNNTGVRAASTGDTKTSHTTMPHHTSTNHYRTAFRHNRYSSGNHRHSGTHHHHQSNGTNKPNHPTHMWTPPPSAQDHQNPKGKQKGKGGKKGKSKQQWQ